MTAHRKTTPLLLAALLPLCTQQTYAGLLDDAKRALNAPATSTAASTATQAVPATGNLLSMVTSGLGVTDQQASGGLGALFKVAQGQLSSGDFAKIASAVPNMDQLLGAAPAVDSNSTGGGLLSQAGALGKSLGGASYLNSAFSKLGLSPDQIAPMANIAVQYLEGSSPEAAALLKQVTGGLM